MHPSDEQQQLEFLQRDLAQRQRRPPTPPKIGAAINDLIARRGYAQQQTASECDQAWRTAVGSALAGKTKAGLVRGGVLEVVVVNSTVLQELTFSKSRLVRRLGELAPEFRIRELRFRVGAIA